MRDQLLKQAKRIVLKIGSSLVASRDSGLRPDRIERLADEVTAVRRSGREVLLVSPAPSCPASRSSGSRPTPKACP